VYVGTQLNTHQHCSDRCPLSAQSAVGCVLQHWQLTFLACAVQPHPQYIVAPQHPIVAPQHPIVAPQPQIQYVPVPTPVSNMRQAAKANAWLFSAIPIVKLLVLICYI
jgi:hypothetical protein